MFENIKVWPYGTRTAIVNKSKNKSKDNRTKSSTPKSYVRLPLDDIKNAKAFHVFYRKTPRSKWVRLTDELEVFPSSIRSKSDKTEFSEMFSSYLVDLYFPKKEKPKKEKPKKDKTKKEKPKKEKPEKAEKPEKIKVGGGSPIKIKRVELELPELPAAPRVTPLKKEIIPQLARIIFDELDGRGYKWPKARIENMINKLWRGFKNTPHLLTSEEFRRNIVVKEILDQSKEERLEGHKTLQEKFRQELEEKEISLDPEIVGGNVKVQIKEVFNKFNMGSKDEQTISMYDPSTLKQVDVDRQIMFVQVVTEYDEFIQVNKDDIESGQEMLSMAINKVKHDVTKIFNESLEKGIFSFDKDPQYSVRLITPMLDVNGQVPETYLDRKGNKTSGNGFSTSRKEVRSLEDLDELLDDLFEDLPKILARYVALNNAMGIGFTGFVIERILR